MSVFLQFAKIFRRHAVERILRAESVSTSRADHIAQHIELIAFLTGYDDLKTGAVALRARPNPIGLSRHHHLHNEKLWKADGAKVANPVWSCLTNSVRPALAQ